MVMYAPGMLKNRNFDFPDKGLRYHFLGGGNEVGNVGCLLDDNKENRILLDYGIAPTDPPKYPLPSPSVKHSIITHSHIDHLGMAPWLCANHRTKLHGTSITANISELMWNDCYKVSKIEGYPLPWDKRDIDTSIHSWEIHNLNESWMQNDWKLTLQNAGPIPGASMLSVKTDHVKVLFTGDFDSRDSMLVEGAKPEKTDVLFIEGTYGGRNHPNQDEERRRFCEEIVRISDRGGTALIPAFAN
jgi:putative mRNA 3-end processing factor